MSPRPKKQYKYPEKIDASPEVIARAILQMKPPKEWKFLNGKRPPREVTIKEDRATGDVK